MASKTSILIFYLRMAKNTQSMLRIASYATLALVNIDGVVLFFLNAFQCSPVAAAFKPGLPATCISIVTLYLCSAPVNIVANLAILVLPIPVLTGMHLPHRQKTVLVFTFSLGIFVTIVDVVRIYYLQKASDDQTDFTKARIGISNDFSWNASTALMWSAVEVNVGIICACIPTLKPLFKKILPSMITDRSRNNSIAKANSFDTGRRPSYPSERTPAREEGDRGVPVIEPLSPTHIAYSHEDESIGMMDFLTTPGIDPEGYEAGMSQMRRTNTHTTAKTTKTMYFGFVSMKRPKSMLVTRGWESFQYCTAVTILFFLWGFSYGLLSVLNSQISQVAHETPSQTLGLACAYFGGYLFGPLTVGQLVLRHGGFKATFITGLCIYGTATLIFWPCAVLKSFPGFIISNFVVGFGLSILETAANPFIALCGPSQYAEYRLLLAQGVQAVGTVLSQLLSEKVLFNKIADDSSLVDVQWTYLGVALFTVILALFFYYMPLPEATDNDLQQLAENLSIFPSQTLTKSFRVPLLWTSVALAVFAQFMYVAGQETFSTFFAALLESLSDSSTFTVSIDNYTLIGHSTFALGRFIFAGLCLYIRPRLLLLFAISAALLFSALSTSLTHISANGIAGPALMLYCFMGPIFPLIFAMGLRGMGSRTKWAASLLTAGVSGGAGFPFVQYATQKINNATVQRSYGVIVAIFAAAMLYPIYLNLFSAARHQVDPAKASLFGHQNAEEPTERKGSAVRRASLRLFAKMGLGKVSSEQASSEHREHWQAPASPV